MTLDKLIKLFQINTKKYYKEHFKDTKDVETEIYKLSKIFALDIWNAYIAIAILIYCLGKYRKTNYYLKEIPKETRNKLNFCFKNFDICFTLYEKIMKRLLKTIKKLDIKLEQFTS